MIHLLSTLFVNECLFILQSEKQTSQKNSDLASSGEHECAEDTAEADQSPRSSATKKCRILTASHVDMNSAFWLQRPHLLM